MKAGYQWIRITAHDPGTMVECFDWLADQNFKYIDSDPGLTPKLGSKIVWDFGFQDVNQAMMFKLTWSGGNV